MKRRRVAGGMLLLVLAGLVVIVGTTLAYTVWSAISLSFFVVAALLVIGGVVLLLTAFSSPDDLSTMAASVENPHHRAPIRAPMMPNPSGGRAYGTTGGGAGIDDHENEAGEREGTEPD